MFLAQQCCARINDDMYALLLLSGFDIKDIDACDGLLCNTFGYPYSPAPQPEEPDPFEELDEEVYEAIELASGFLRRGFRTIISTTTRCGVSRTTTPRT